LLTAAGAAVIIPAAKAEREENAMLTEAERMTAYCGRFCGTCGISAFQIGTGLAAVRNVVKAVGFKREAEGLGWPLMRDLATHCCEQFEGQVEAFGKVATKLFPTCCREGCVPPCEIAQCCKGKGHATCAACGDVETCEKIAATAKKNPKVRNNLREIAKQGLKPWAEAQLKAVKAARRRVLTEAVEKAVG
jgi:hypothetical protein